MNTARLHDALDSEISKNLYRHNKRAILAKTRVKLFILITALMMLYMSVSWLF